MKRSARSRKRSRSAEVRGGAALDKGYEDNEVREIEISTERKTQLVEITREVQSALNGAESATAALIFVPHTTAGVTINEHADPAVARDLEAAMERVVGEDWGWEHIEEGEENAPSHVRASLAGPQVLVPLDGGRLALGTWQGIFFCEFDGPRKRKVYVTPLA